MPAEDKVKKDVLAISPRSEGYQLDLIDTPPKIDLRSTKVSVVVSRNGAASEATLRTKGGGIAKIDCTTLNIVERARNPPATQDSGLRHGKCSCWLLSSIV